MFFDQQERTDTPITKPIFIFYSIFQLLGTLIWGVCIVGLGVIILQNTDIYTLKGWGYLVPFFSMGCIFFGLKNRVLFAIQGIRQLKKPKLVLYPDRIEYFNGNEKQVIELDKIQKIGYEIYNDFLFFINHDLKIEFFDKTKIKLDIRDLDADEIIIFNKLKTHLNFK